MRKKKGFTLIELLAVIVILAIIALISVPIILDVIERTRKKAYEQSLRSIFDATDLYLVSSGLIEMPNDGININDSLLKINHNNFTSGKVIRNEQGEFELDKVSDGVYCGSGTLNNLEVLEGSCDSLDTTPPTVNIAANLVTSNSITIVANGEDLESGINGYQFSIDNGLTWTSKQTSNVHTFANLISNTEYTFKTKVFNNNNLETLSNELIVSTVNIDQPVYSVDNSGWSQSKVVTITYPEREAGYSYEYSLDEGLTWEEVASPATTKDITFNSNGSVIARISDGVNIITGLTYQITNIDTVNPTLNVPSTTTITTEQALTYDLLTGVSTSDNSGLTPSISTSGTLGSTPGDYTITYTATDEAGNYVNKSRVFTVYYQYKSATGTAIVDANETINVTGLDFTPSIVVIRGLADELRYIALASTPQTTTGLQDDAYSSYLNVGNTTCTKVYGGFTYVLGDNSRNRFGSGTSIRWYAYESYDATGTSTVDTSETISVSGLDFTPSVVVVRGLADELRYIALASTPQTTTGLQDDAYSSYLNVGNTTCTKVYGGFTYVLGDNSRNRFGSGTSIRWYAFK